MPAKLYKKKRPPPATASADGSSMQSNVVGALPDEPAKVMTIDTAVEYYGRLQRDSRRLDFRFNAILWLHQVVGLVVVNVLMYDWQPQLHKGVLVAWSALWLGRGFIVEHLTGIATGAKAKRDVTRRRYVVMAVCVGAALALHYLVHKTMSQHTALLFTTVLLADVSSIRSVGQLISPYTAINDIGDMALIISAFSTQYNELSLVIYDRGAVMFVTATLAIHYCVVRGIKHALFELPWTTAAQTKQNQYRRLEAVEAISREADQGEHGFYFASITKESKTPSEDAASHGSLDMVSRWLALQTATVALQIVATALVLHSWELCSMVICTSVHLLVEVLMVHSALTRPHPLYTSVHESLGIAATTTL